MPNKIAPFYPIIYVRGYAMTEQEINETTADPFCGFNKGSTVYRAVPDEKKPPRKFIFESPIIRLASDFGYRDVYESGYDIMDEAWESDSENKVSNRSVIIYRYYDEASMLLGVGETPTIDSFATGLGKLILRVRDLVCGNEDNGIVADDFRCYLVAHSMGGLICRAFLQNPESDKKNARKYVDKLFTYATPHNGIDFVGTNVPSWLSPADINNFNRSNIARYLGITEIYERTKRVDWISESRFSPEKIFCMVGTNRMDYEVLFGLSRTFAGHGSDGLVKIENAVLNGIKSNGQPGEPCEKAFAYRSHSGHFGIVNSEEAYQNLIRFLFGDVRVAIWVDIDEIRLPQVVREAEENGHKINALYQIEALASPRGKLWYLTRRTTEEDSAACLTHQEWVKGPQKNRSKYISTIFLANRSRVDKQRRSLAYSMTLGIRVPDYEIDKKLWINEHFEGGYLFRDTIILEMIPPEMPPQEWRVRYAWQGRGLRAAETEIPASKIKNGKVEVLVDFDSETSPGVKGQIRFVISAWNPDAVQTE